MRRHSRFWNPSCLSPLFSTRFFCCRSHSALFTAQPAFAGGSVGHGGSALRMPWPYWRFRVSSYRRWASAISPARRYSWLAPCRSQPRLSLCCCHSYGLEKRSPHEIQSLDSTVAPAYSGRSRPILEEGRPAAPTFSPLRVLDSPDRAERGQERKFARKSG